MLWPDQQGTLLNCVAEATADSLSVRVASSCCGYACNSHFQPGFGLFRDVDKRDDVLAHVTFSRSTCELRLGMPGTVMCVFALWCLHSW